MNDNDDEEEEEEKEEKQRGRGGQHERGVREGSDEGVIALPYVCICVTNRSLLTYYLFLSYLDSSMYGGSPKDGLDMLRINPNREYPQ